jgi:CRP-like cAMP-binding protein
MNPLHNPQQNHLLAALPPEDFELFASQLELVPMPLGQMLYEPGTQLRHAYFPTTSIVSLHYVTESGASAETAGVGNEGVVGISLFMGGDTTPTGSIATCCNRSSTGPAHCSVCCCAIPRP